eukprot:7802300-Alexandrium_andersonii.AAC.1
MRDQGEASICMHRFGRGVAKDAWVVVAGPGPEAQCRAEFAPIAFDGEQEGFRDRFARAHLGSWPRRSIVTFVWALASPQGLQGPGQKRQYRMDAAPPAASAAALLRLAEQCRQVASACVQVVQKEPDERVLFPCLRRARVSHAVYV